MSVEVLWTSGGVKGMLCVYEGEEGREREREGERERER